MAFRQASAVGSGTLGQSPAGIYAMARQIRIPVRQVRQSFDGILTPLIAALQVAVVYALRPLYLALRRER